MHSLFLTVPHDLNGIRLTRKVCRDRHSSLGRCGDAMNSLMTAAFISGETVKHVRTYIHGI